jgi:hypothetical protein
MERRPSRCRCAAAPFGSLRTIVAQTFHFHDSSHRFAAIATYAHRCGWIAPSGSRRDVSGKIACLAGDWHPGNLSAFVARFFRSQVSAVD